MKAEVCVVNAFTKDGRGGNPAGVVVDAAGLTDARMLEIAARAGFSETAFIQPSAQADFHLRFFTPTAEVDLCGHATIASFALLHRKNRIRPGTYSQQTASGVLRIEVGDDGAVMMDQLLPTFSDMVAREEAADALGIPIEEIPAEAQVVSTGLRDILVPVKTRAALLALKPDFERIAALSERWDTVGVHAYTQDALTATAYCRNFAPRFGINEECATGTSNGALACLLFKNGHMTNDGAKKLTVEQGYAMNRPSEILVQLAVDGNRITRVQVGGQAFIERSAIA